MNDLLCMLNQHRNDHGEDGANIESGHMHRSCSIRWLLLFSDISFVGEICHRNHKQIPATFESTSSKGLLSMHANASRHLRFVSDDTTSEEHLEAHFHSNIKERC